MAAAGIDMGARSTKVVILEGDRVLAAVTLQTGESGESEARQAMDQALRQAQLKLEELTSVVATGTGRLNVPFTRKHRSIVTCLARGAHFLFPQARTVLDARAESSMAYFCEDIIIRGAWEGPAALELFHHALAPVAALPVLAVLGGVHIQSDLTLGLGTVVHDYLTAKGRKI